LDINPEIRMSTEQFLEMDSAIASHEIMSDMEIVEEVLCRSNPLPPENNSEDEQDEVEINAEFLKKLRQLTRKATLKVAQQKKQQNISSFFDNES
ncbi:4592_t:CDS:2, partial [Acaulospora morrowiae]